MSTVGAPSKLVGNLQWRIKDPVAGSNFVTRYTVHVDRSAFAARPCQAMLCACTALVILPLSLLKCPLQLL